MCIEKIYDIMYIQLKKKYFNSSPTNPAKKGDDEKKLMFASGYYIVVDDLNRYTKQGGTNDYSKSK